MPKLSIITINLNNAQGLETTMASVFSQTYADYEYIIIDGGSTDTSKELIEKYQNRFAYKVSKKDKGVYHAMNKGIKRAKGEYCMFLNSGDYLLNNDVLKSSVMATEEKNADIYYGNIVIEFEKGKPVIKKHADQISLEVLQNETINHQASFIKTSLFEELGLYDTSYSLAADHAFYVKAYLYGKSFQYIDSEMVCYQMDGISSLNFGEYRLQMTESYRHLIQKIKPTPYNRFSDFRNIMKFFKKRSCVIVIPIHSASPSKKELLSFAQCFKILSSHPIKIVAPKDLDLTEYKKVTSKFEVIFIDSKWQSSIDDYNRLKISPFFYNNFKNYKFLLTYELDAFVFKDELDYWCKQGYDYIGAPWTGIYGYDYKPLRGVGNSGFSIRNVSKCIKILKYLRVKSVLDEYKYFNWKGLIPRLPKFLFKLFNAAFRSSETKVEYEIHEDLFWCKHAPFLLSKTTYDSLFFRFLARVLIKNNFKIAPEEIAMQFSFETEARKLYQLNHEKLPFGCHGWMKYEPDFWQAFIPEVTLMEVKNA